MRRIGILGGTFNPIHLGHLFVGRSAAEAFGLDAVLLAPCNVSPFKCGQPGQASAADRLEMVRLCAAEDPLFEACAIDLERGGVSYAVDTVRILRERSPGDRFFFIVGMDALRELHHWRRIEEMLALCDVVTVERPGCDAASAIDLSPFAPAERERLRAGIVRGRLFDVSSSEIRRRIAEGESIRYLVCPAVEAYIRARGLYVATKEGDH